MSSFDQPLSATYHIRLVHKQLTIGTNFGTAGFIYDIAMNPQPNHQDRAPPFDRDRELEGPRPLPHADEIAQRERDRRDQERRDGYPPGMQHSTAGSIPIHQPVASRVAGAIHSPEALLANHRANGLPPQNPVGASGPSQVYGGPPSDATRQVPRPGPHLNNNNHNGAGPAPQHQAFSAIPNGASGPGAPSRTAPPVSVTSQPAFAPGPHDGHQQSTPTHAPTHTPATAPFGGSSPSHSLALQSQQQQPILNDALDYLDQVKIQFLDQPSVYNHFLDIMKDFKSQAIDTPGVITRVSELFVGHPILIQGFNTFLPPGYRIECGPGNDPNAIRVTTPMGTLVQTIPGGGFLPEVIGPEQTGQPQRFPESAAAPELSNGHINPPPQVASVVDNLGPTNQLSVPQNAQTPTTVAAQIDLSGVAGAEAVANAAAQQSSERRGPVEFNHAISYVNKIKVCRAVVQQATPDTRTLVRVNATRFHDNPETYKQFLEILQTYQREQKPIQDVYDQVTTLFQSAPDLLEDFKQFLPEHAAQQSKLTPTRLTEEPISMPGPSHTPQLPMRDVQKMPPLGSFAPPPSASKETKKRPRNEKQIQPGPQPAEVSNSSLRTANVAANGNKKPKLNHKSAGIEVNSTIEPSLTPNLSEPFPLSSPLSNNRKEIHFFEKVKKFLGSRAAMNEFLKICNLFNQEIIDRTALYERGCTFFQTSSDLMSSWRSLVGQEEQDAIVGNRPAPPSGKVSLSNCRGYGPSYRLLPKRERLRPCSGRDELCNSVLNDEWASHPTWASEDSGFVAHRKNLFEEGLHRIEEERHDYDFNIEANVKCIQLLEPIAQQMLIMTPAEREQFDMNDALAGQSVSIFKRVAKKLYGERGISVINDLWSNPFEVLPVLLSRMKQKDEDWRFSQREWNKVWHAQSENMHLRSLDHQGIHVKVNDKRNLSAKHMVDVVKTKAEDQRRVAGRLGEPAAHQFLWEFTDRDVIIDLMRLVLIFNHQNSQHSSTEKERITQFFLGFIASYFGIPEEQASTRLPDYSDESADDEGDEPILDVINGRARRNGKRGDLRRGVLDRLGGAKPRDQKEDSAASGSKETTPDGTSGNEEDMPDASEEASAPSALGERWLGVMPEPLKLPGFEFTAGLKADGLFDRPWYNFFCNQTVFVLLSILHALYSRMKEVKESTDSVLAGIERQNYNKPAKHIGLTDNTMDYFSLSHDRSRFWPMTMTLIEEYLEGDRDENSYHEILRFYYMKSGWKLYTIQDLIKTLCRLSLVCTSLDPKEKTPDLIAQYQNNRRMEQTSYEAELACRKTAEKYIKDGEMFVVTWYPAKSEATVRWLQKDDATFHSAHMDRQEKWQYYISSYMRVEPTEGIPRSRVQKSVLARNLPGSDAEPDQNNMPNRIASKQELATSICLDSFKMVWNPNTEEFFVFDNRPKKDEARAEHAELQRRMKQYREVRLKKNFVHNNAWMKDLSQEQVQTSKNMFQNWVSQGVAPEDHDVDVEMTG